MSIIVKYGAARLALFFLLTAVIQGLAIVLNLPVPLPISALLALLIAFPLSMFLFKRMREDMVAQVADFAERRRAHKEWVASQLDGR